MCMSMRDSDHAVDINYRDIKRRRDIDGARATWRKRETKLDNDKLYTRLDFTAAFDRNLTSSQHPSRYIWSYISLSLSFFLPFLFSITLFLSLSFSNSLCLSLSDCHFVSAYLPTSLSFCDAVLHFNFGTMFLIFVD